MIKKSFLIVSELYYLKNNCYDNKTSFLFSQYNYSKAAIRVYNTIYTISIILYDTKIYL